MRSKKQPVIRINDKTFLALDELRALYKESRGVELTRSQCINLILNRTDFYKQLRALRKEVQTVHKNI